MKKHNDQKINQVLKEVVGHSGFQYKYFQFLVRKFWKEEMAKLVVDSTSSVYLQERVVVLKITSAPLKQELHYNKEKLIKKLNSYLKSNFVNEIRIM